jgi:hypothetical protein
VNDALTRYNWIQKNAVEWGTDACHEIFNECAVFIEFTYTAYTFHVELVSYAGNRLNRINCNTPVKLVAGFFNEFLAMDATAIQMLLAYFLISQGLKANCLTQHSAGDFFLFGPV